MNTENFIKRAKELHGDKYDYSKSEYKGGKEKICIICPEHGEFWQLPYNHISRTNYRGCPKCNGGIKNSAEDFIDSAIKVHEKKYDYSKVNYVNAITKVCIICPEHGEFWQIPSSHLSGAGCPKCWEERKGKSLLSSTEKFIEKARKVHGNKYIYDKVNYERSSKKVCITCPEHGEFMQTPNKHLLGQGCPECSKRITAEKKKLTTDEFIKSAMIVHGNKYDYTKTDLENRDEKGRIIITCPVHGDFLQTPQNHLYGKGCEKCGIEARANKKRISQEDVIKRFVYKHGKKYGYEKAVYKGMHSNLTITCYKHGDFECTPANHLAGKGCPKCNISHAENDVEQMLNNNGIKYEYNVGCKKIPFLGRLTLDFYLPDYNVAIECQGKQHFCSINYFGGSEQFKRRLELDSQKKKLCNTNGIKLLYYSEEKIEFPYKVFTNLDELLNAILTNGELIG